MIKYIAEFIGSVVRIILVGSVSGGHLDPVVLRSCKII